MLFRSDPERRFVARLCELVAPVECFPQIGHLARREIACALDPHRGVVVAFLGTALATAAGRHIRIGYFVDGLPPRARRGFEMLGLLLVMLMFGIVGWWGASLTWDEYQFEILSSGLGHPQWWYTGWMPLLSVAVILRALGRLIRLARGGEG